MSTWHKQALSRLSTLDALSDGMSTSPTPHFGTRGNVSHVSHLKLATSNTSPKPQLDQPFYSTHGSLLLGAWWALWGLAGFAMIAQGGGGGWMAFSLFGLLAMLRQSSNLLVVSNRSLLIRDGVAGGRTRIFTCSDIDDVWVHQSLLGRWLDYGRVGMRNSQNDIVWSPVLAHPFAAKNAIVLAVTGRRPVGIPPSQQTPLRGI